MSRFLGFGDGTGGAVPSSGTFQPGTGYGSGSSGSTSFVYGNVSGVNNIANGNRILILQTCDDGEYGYYEENEVVSGGGLTSGTWTLRYPLENTYYSYSSYNNSPPNPGIAVAQRQCQVIKIVQYAGGTISGTLTANHWNGRAYGIVPLWCSGALVISGAVSVNGGNGSFSRTDQLLGGAVGGFRGGKNSSDGSSAGHGEGYYGEWNREQGENGGEHNYSGGGGKSYPHNGGGGGGGGGENGYQSPSPYDPGRAGVGVSAISRLVPGGGGGGGHDDSQNAGSGGSGGGIIYIAARELTVTGYCYVKGGNGGGGTSASYGCGGGGGGGGTILINTEKLTVDSNALDARGGAGGVVVEHLGGAGGRGKIIINACSINATPSSTYGIITTSIGGKDYCGIYGGMI